MHYPAKTTQKSHTTKQHKCIQQNECKSSFQRT